MGPLKMYFLLDMVIFHCYVSLLEGNISPLLNKACYFLGGGGVHCHQHVQVPKNGGILGMACFPLHKAYPQLILW